MSTSSEPNASPPRPVTAASPDPPSFGAFSASTPGASPSSSPSSPSPSAWPSPPSCGASPGASPEPAPRQPPPSPFAFQAAWYPLSPLEDLQPGRPTAVELLGRRYVIWKPPGPAGGQGLRETPPQGCAGLQGQGSGGLQLPPPGEPKGHHSGAPPARGFRVFLDLCPHRLAPLSQGRIDPDSGLLTCSYHGWSFDGDGLCRRIPQAATPCPAERQARHLAATSLPVREAVGLLWLWPDPASAALAEATPLPLSPFVDAAEGFRWSSFVRELPYDWRTLIENVADPAHVPFAHHGIQGDRRRAGPIPLQLREQSARRIVAEVSSRAIAMHTTIVFQPPSLLEYRFTFPGNRRMGLITYGLPVAPGRCRLVAQFSRDWSSPWWQWRPRWWDHLFNRNEVLDGDLLMLVEQERELARRGSDGHRADWRQAYRLPTSSDRLVIAFQHWLERHGGPDWEALLAGGAAEASGRQAIVSRQGSAAEPGPSAGSAASGVAEGAAGIGSGQRQSAFRASSIAAAPPASSRQLLDRHQQHTQHCASCRQALAWTRRLQGIGLLLFVLSLAAAALLPDAARLPLGLPLLLLGLVGLAAAAGLRFGLEPWFRYRPYDHTRR